MAKESKRPPGVGRPPTGLKGEKISRDYHSVRLRVPPDVRRLVEVAAAVLRRPQWRVWVDAFMAYVGEGQALSEDKRKAIRDATRAARRVRVNGD
jgi:hypothetical protein